MFGNNISFYIYFTFLDYTPLNDDDYREKESSRKLSPLNAWIATAITRLEQPEKLGGHAQKSYADTITGYVSEAVNLFIG